MWPWWVKIPTEDFTDETLVIDDTHEDDVRGGDWGAGHGGWQGGWWGDRHGDWQLDWYGDEYSLKNLLVWLAIFDTYGDDVRCNDVGAGHGGWQGGKISN